MDVWKMASRNVRRNRRRTIVTIGAMSFALLVMILYTGLIEGYLNSMERNVLDLEVGDLQVFAADYRENPSIYTRIENPEEVLAPLEAAGFPASTRLLAFGLAAVDDASAGVSFRGVDVERDARVSRIHEQVEQGQWIDGSDVKGVVIGRRLARTLGAAPGAELLALSQGADGAMAYDLFVVRGVLRSVSDATDRTGVFMLEDTFRELFVVPNGVHQIIVRRPGDVALLTALGDVESMATEHDVRSWRQLLPTVASMLDSARGVQYAMFFIVYLAVGILVLNAMLMAVFERIREIGVLKALGVGPADVLALIAVESSIQLVSAIAVAVTLAIPSLYYLTHTGIDLGALAGTSVLGVAMDPSWRATTNARVFAAPIVMMVAVVTVSVVYPALKGAWIRPVDAMRHH